MSYPFNHLGSIPYHSEPSEVPYSSNQFLGWEFFADSYSKTALAFNPHSWSSGTYFHFGQKFILLFQKITSVINDYICLRLLLLTR